MPELSRGHDRCVGDFLQLRIEQLGARQGFGDKIDGTLKLPFFGLDLSDQSSADRSF
jgi:hypothetical protein